MLSFFITILVLSIIVFVHEMGHFLLARFLGISVFRFSIGFGPLLFGMKDKKGTIWQVSLIPLGGYVQLDEKKLFGLKKTFISLAGPFMNFVLAFVSFFSLFWTFGALKVEPIVKEVVPKSLAAQHDIRPKDEILTVDGKSALEIKNVLKQFKKVTFKIKRGHETLTKEIVMLEPQLGIMFETQIQKLTLQDSLKYSVFTVLGLCKKVFESFFSFIGLKNVGSIVSIVSTSRAHFNHGLQAFLTFVAVFSVNLGFINLLPIPILDGGNAVIGLYETITGKRLKKTIYHQIMMIGAWILLFFFVIGFVNDIFRGIF